MDGLNKVTQDLPPASYADITLAVNGQSDVPLSLPVLRPGQVSIGPGGIPDVVLDHPPGEVSADTSQAGPATPSASAAA